MTMFRKTITYEMHTDKVNGTFCIVYNKMSRLVGKPTMWFPNRSDTNRPVQSQKKSLKLEIPNCTIRVAKTKALISEADLRLCFRLCRLLVFP